MAGVIGPRSIFLKLDLRSVRFFPQLSDGKVCTVPRFALFIISKLNTTETDLQVLIMNKGNYGEIRRQLLSFRMKVWFTYAFENDSMDEGRALSGRILRNSGHTAVNC